MKHNTITGESDGTPQEITDLYKNMGFNSADVFKKKGKTFFSLMPAVIFIILNVALLFFDIPLVGKKYLQRKFLL